MSINDNIGRNRAKFRRVYAYGLARRPDIREFVDALTDTTKSFNFQQIIRDRNYYVIQGDMVQTFPTASIETEYYEEAQVTTSPVSYMDVVFPSAFSHLPFMGFLLTPEDTTSGSNVAYWATNLSTTGFRANFSAPFEGRLLYRAVYTPGSYPVYVSRDVDKFAWVSAGETVYADVSEITMSFAPWMGTPSAVLSTPVGTPTDAFLDVAQNLLVVGGDFTTNELSAPISGSIDVVAMWAL